MTIAWFFRAETVWHVNKLFTLLLREALERQT